jgi:hypothetical protein
MAWRGLRFAAVVIATCAVAHDAQAYCRTTTCDPKIEACPVDANGCTRAGAPLTWRSLPIVYRFHSKSSDRLDRDNAREAVRSAFQRWSDVTCANGRTSLRFAEQEDIEAHRPRDPHLRGADHFGIYFRDDVWAATDPDSTLALTTQTYGKINGWVEEADIEINTTSAAFATSDSAIGIDLQAVLTHEVGHYIGLAHSPSSDSIMVDSYCKSGTRCDQGKVEARRLGHDDEAAVCALFPPSGPAGVRYEDPEAASCAVGPSTARGSWLPLAGAAFVLAALRRRRVRVSSNTE